MKTISICLVIIFKLFIIRAISHNNLKFNFHKWVENRTESDYMECLDKNKEIKVKVTVQTHLVSYGTALRLNCDHLCLNYSESIENLWVFRSFNKLRIKSVNSFEKAIKINTDLSLELKDLNESATYYCINSGKIYAIHDISVVEDESFHITLITKKAKHTTRLNDSLLEKTNFKIFSQWTRWSQCNRCNQTGIRKRVGFCKIKKINASSAVKPKSIPLFDYEFKDSGIPCRSKHLHQIISSIQELKERKSEIEFSFCRKPCPETNETAKFSEKFDKRAFMKKIKKWSEFSGSFLSAKVGERVVISCSRASNDFPYYIWKNISKINKWSYYMNPMKIHVRTKGRVKIDFMNNLVIREVLTNDDAYYGCFHLDRLVSVTRLYVDVMKEEELSFVNAILVNFVTLFLVFILITFSSSLWNNRNIRTKR